MASIFCPFLGGILCALVIPGKILTLPFPFAIVGMALFLGQLSLYRQKENCLTLKMELMAVVLFAVGFGCFLFSWIVYTFQELYGIPAPWNMLLLLPYSLVETPKYFLFVLLGRGIKKFSQFNVVLNQGQKQILLALALTMIEHYTPQFIPYYLGYLWQQAAPYLGLAPVGGLPLFSFFSYYMALTLLMWYRTRVWNRLGVSATAIFVILNIVIPLNRVTGDKVIRTRLVQPNIDNTTKSRAKMGNRKAQQYISRQLQTLSSKPGEKPLDLIIWPETAVPHYVFFRTPQIVQRIVSQTGVSLVTGGYQKSYTPKTLKKALYNSIFFYGPQANLRGIYRKKVLVPFIEFLPFGSLNKHVKPYFDLTLFERGKDYPLFETSKGFRFFGIICYETLFFEHVREYLSKQTQSPHFIINLTNDSYYGNTSGPWQHNFVAHWRALEFNLPIIRTNNTGISSVLYPDGSSSRQLMFSETGILDVDVKIGERIPTVFEKYGIFVTWITGIILFLCAGFFRR